MQNHNLQLIVIPMILAVAVLFGYSVFNPVEAFRKDQDEQVMSFLQNRPASASASASRCFRPISKFYQTDPRSVYNEKGQVSVGEGYLCLK